MTENKRKLWGTITLVLLSCAVMALIETVIEPAYWVKSACKGVFFLLLPLLVMVWQREKLTQILPRPTGKQILWLAGLGLAIYGVIMVAYFMTAGLFDYSVLVQSLTADQSVSPRWFWGVAAYISFGNSLLEEFLFRFVSFLLLRKYAPRWVAYLFSSLAFAVYHIGMIGSSFPWPLLILSLIGLALGGCIFNFVDEKSGSIAPSWIIHMFADFAIMTIWYLHIG